MYTGTHFSTKCPPLSTITDTKVIVTVPQLLQLIPDTCYICNCSAPLSLSHRFRGCSIVITLQCKNDHEYLWSSSPQLINSAGYAVHSNNLVLACGMLCSGNTFAKVKRMMDFIGLKCISQATYYTTGMCSYCLNSLRAWNHLSSLCHALAILLLTWHLATIIRYQHMSYCVSMTVVN